MKFIIAGIVLCFFGTTNSFAKQSQHDQDVAKTILALEDKIVKSIKNNNPDSTNDLVAERFVTTDHSGKRSGKVESISSAHTQIFTDAELIDVRIDVFGNTVIATGKFKGKGTELGKPFEENECWTDVWMKMPNGKWQIIANQNSPIVNN